MSPQKDGSPEKVGMGGPVSLEELEALADKYFSAPRTEEEMQAFDDHCWASDDPEIARVYEGKIIAVHKRQVIAVGDDWKAVIEEGEHVSGLPRNCFAVMSIPDTASFFGCH